MRLFIISALFLSTGIFLFNTIEASDYETPVSTHGMLLECDNETHENHLYLMNAKKLGLSEKQIEQLQDIKGDCDKFCVMEKARLRVAKTDLNEMLKSKNIDMKKAEEKIREISELQNSLRIRHLKMKVEAMMVLTDDQKEKAKTLR